MKIEEAKEITYDLIDTFLEAGEISLNLREKGLIKKIKSDNTPVTNADIDVNNIITAKINEITPSIPIVSEENSENKNSYNLTNFWLVDPIDGTYDFINNKDEFTLNACLVINKTPLIGIINAPAKNRLFFSYWKNFSFELRNGIEVKLNCKKLSKNGEVKAVSYSDNLKQEISEIHNKYGVTEYVKMKSSYKFCVIASGEFDIYVAEARASEWDIAAGHAILNNAGGIITDFKGNEIFYGKKDFVNPSLILRRSLSL